MEVRAVAKYVGISQQKLQRIADMVRGKGVEESLAILRLYQTPASRAVAKVIKSAASNAENNHQMAISQMKVTKLFIDQGSTLKRIRAQARGRVSPILKHSSHITAVVDMEA